MLPPPPTPSLRVLHIRVWDRAPVALLLNRYRSLETIILPPEVSYGLIHFQVPGMPVSRLQRVGFCGGDLIAALHFFLNEDLFPLIHHIRLFGRPAAYEDQIATWQLRVMSDRNIRFDDENGELMFAATP